MGQNFTVAILEASNENLGAFLRLPKMKLEVEFVGHYFTVTILEVRDERRQGADCKYPKTIMKALSSCADHSVHPPPQILLDGCPLLDFSNFIKRKV